MTEHQETYFEALQPKVEKLLEAYKEDFRVHDRSALKGYQGKFILGVRSTGTNLLRFSSEGKLRGDSEVEFLSEENKAKLDDLVNSFLFYEGLFSRLLFPLPPRR